MAPRDLRTRLVRRASRANLFLTDELVERLAAYYELLSKWNRKINLTALEDPDEAVDRLLLEPVAAARHVPAQGLRLMDIGSGGGSPAIPLAMAGQVASLTMVEVKARKSAFLREAIRTLGLQSSQVETVRFEELLVRPDTHEAFELLSIRAVRIEAKALTALQAFLAPGGTFLMFRGPGGQAEPAGIPQLKWLETVPLIETLQSRLTILQKTG